MDRCIAVSCLARSVTSLLMRDIEVAPLVFLGLELIHYRVGSHPLRHF